MATDTSDSSQGTLAGAAGAIIGGGLSELQADKYIGLALVLVGAVLVVIRAHYRFKQGKEVRMFIRAQATAAAAAARPAN